MIALTISRPEFTSWTFSGSLKPVLLLGLATTSSFALVTSISKSDKAKDDLRQVLETTAKPFKPLVDELGKGSVKMFNSLSEWAQYGRPIINAIYESLASGSISEGARAIFHKLKEWLDSIYEMLKIYGPWLFKKENWSNLKSLSQIIKNLFDTDINGNAPLIFSLFKATGNKEFTNFMSTIGKFAESQKETFNNFSSEDMGKLFDAFNADSQFTQKVLEEFSSKQTENTELKEELMKALKPATLKGRIQEAIVKARGYLDKGQLMTPEDKRGAQESKTEIQKLREELRVVIEEAKKDLQKQRN